MIDLYTKTILSIIALALVTIVAMTTTTTAQSSGPANAVLGGSGLSSLGGAPLGGSYQRPPTARDKAAFRRGQRLGEAYRRGLLPKPRHGV